MNTAVLASVLLLSGSPSPSAPAAPPSSSAAPPTVPAAVPTPLPHSYWIRADPQDADEKALRDTLAAAAGRPPGAVAQTLAAFSIAHPGTLASGLAQLAAGLLLADAGQAGDAMPHLRHPDVARTALGDYAALALAHGLEGTDPRAAGEAYASLLATYSDTPLGCTALLRGAESFEKAGLPAKALPMAERALSSCGGFEPAALLVIGKCQERQQSWSAAAAAYDRIDHDFPLSDSATEAAVKLRALSRSLPAEAAAVRAARDLKKALLVFDANRPAHAAPLFRKLLVQRAPADQLDLVRVRLGRCLLEMKHWREAEAQLRAVSADSPMAAEAAFFLARLQARRGNAAVYQYVATRFAGTPWGEEALLALANARAKDGAFDEALPFFRQMLHDYPDGAFAERAAWWVGLGEIKDAHYDAAATMMEAAARKWTSPLTPGFLFWAGEARLSAGKLDAGRALLLETVRRYKYSYHGRRALLALGKLPPAPAAAPAPPIMRRPDPSADLSPVRLTRVRQLLLVDRSDDAIEELKLQPANSTSQATIAWIHWQRGRLRLAINAMKRAYPEYIGEAADQLPEDVLKILYPIQFQSELTAKAHARGLDAALVAALINQESTFDPAARSPVGAVGLMQIMAPTGRLIAKALGIRFRRQSLHNPEVSLDLGTRYLRDMLDRYDGRVERALAAYNAGPNRVEAWTASRPHVSAEEFVETIPFTETRGYVMSILSMTERYRDIYGLGAPAPAAKG